MTKNKKTSATRKKASPASHGSAPPVRLHAAGSAALVWTVETPRAGGWWWLEHDPGQYEAVLVWSPQQLDDEYPEEEKHDEWLFETRAWMGWMSLRVTRGLRWAGGPAKSRDALGGDNGAQRCQSGRKRIRAEDMGAVGTGTAAPQQD
jgi:hypothetical protein